MTPAVFLAAAVAIAAVALGLALGLGSGGGSRLVGPLRTFAFAAALTVALTHLLPEALAELGAPGLLLFAAASVTPAWGELLRGFGRGAKSHGGHGGAVLGAGYLGLLVHHVGDGLGLGAYSELPGGALAHADVLAALAVHTVPLVAVVTLAFRTQRGVRAAVGRAGGLAAASVGGVLLSGVVPVELTRSLSAWIAAGVAGLLLHVVTHDLGRDLPATTAARALDWAALLAGVAASTFGADPALVALRNSMLASLASGAVLAAQAWVAAGVVLAAAGVLAAQNDLARRLWHRSGGERALPGALIGTGLVGFRFGILFWVGTALTTQISGLHPRHRPENNTHPPHDPDHHHHHAHSGAHAHSDAHAHSHGEAHSDAHAHSHAEGRSHANGDAERRSHAGDHAAVGLVPFLRASAPSLVAGLVVYALLVAALAPEALAGLSAPLALGGAAFCGLALELPSAPAVLVAIALWQRGLRPDAVLAFALMASSKTHSRPWALAGALLVGIGVGSANAASPLAFPHAVFLALPTLIAFAILLAVMAWHRGPRAFFATVFHSHDSA